MQVHIFGVMFAPRVRADQFPDICDRIRPSERQISTKSSDMRQIYFFQRLKGGSRSGEQEEKEDDKSLHDIVKYQRWAVTNFTRLRVFARPTLRFRVR